MKATIDHSMLIRSIVGVLMLIGFTLSVQAQELPDLNQRLTRSIVYNPSLAGLNSGNISYVYRSYWDNVEGAPQLNLISAQVPVAQYRVGIGLNYYNDKVNILNYNYFSASFAYRFFIGENSLSLGLSGEYSVNKIDPDLVISPDLDPLISDLSENPQRDFDFNFGLHYESKYFSIGGSANRLKSLIQDSTTGIAPPNYYTGYLEGTIPMSGTRDLLQPVISYRQNSQSNNAVGQLDLGIYYHYNEVIHAGFSYGINNNFGAQVGFSVEGAMLNYTYSNNFGQTLKGLGDSHEIWIGFNFMSLGGYQSKFTTDLEKTRKARFSRRRSGNAGLSNRKKNELNPDKKYSAGKQFNKPKKRKKVKPPKRKRRKR